MTGLEEDREERARLWFLRVWTTIGGLVLAYVSWRVLKQPLTIVVPPLLLAAAIVYVLNPVVTRLQHRGLPRVAGTALAYVVLIAVATAIGFLVGPIIGRQVSSFADQLPRIAGDIVNQINGLLAQLGVPTQVPRIDPASGTLSDAMRRFFSGAGDAQLQAVLTSAGGVVLGVIHVLAIIILGPVLAFYLLYDLPQFKKSVTRLIPPDRRDEVVGVTKRVIDTVGGYFRGQLLVAAFVGTATAIGLALIGLPFAAFVGVVAGVFNLVPLIGPFIAGAIGVVIALTVGGGVTQALLVVVIETAVQQLDNHVITPNVQRRAVDLNPVTIMLGLLLGGALGGLIGALFVIPVLGALKVVMLHIMARTVPWALPPNDIVPEAAVAEDRVDDDFYDGAAEEIGPTGHGEEPAVESPDRADDEPESPTGEQRAEEVVGANPPDGG